jgi:pimeloyl-ACP methyl ester carboxylesterase
LARVGEDLDHLLNNSGEHAPYVLVGHSWGGWVVTVYARKHPENVAGVVLVDSSLGFDPPVIEPMPASHSGPPAGPMVIKKASDEDELFKKLPPSDYRAYLWTQSLPRFDDVDDPDEPLKTVQTATEGKLPLHGKPLILIAARHGDGAMDENTEKGETIRANILALSRHSKLIWVDSRHHVQLDKPGAVVSAVREIIEHRF